jgi:histidyl-tRNA synthetase
MGSILGGGRYDDLTGLFGLKGMSGIGISFGLDRIYDVLSELDLFPKGIQDKVKLLIATMDKDSFDFGFRCMQELRAKGICAELYPKPGKLNRQLDYANARHIPFVGIIGESEVAGNVLSVKNMHSGTQELMDITKLAAVIQES